MRNIYWRNTRTEKHFASPGNPISTDPPAATPAAASRERNVVCEFCECTLAKDGNVLKFSDRAKQLRDLEAQHERARKDLEGQIATLRQERDELNNKLLASSSPNSPASRGGSITIR